MSNKVTKTEIESFEKSTELVKAYSNGEVTVYWRPELCIHSTNCLVNLPLVFNTRRRPWIDMNGDNSKEIIKTVNTCPSRALTFLKNEKSSLRKTRKRKKKIPKFARIEILKDGPLLIKGNFIIRDAQKKKIRIKTEVAAFCRCGGSKKIPFCDGTHKKLGFKG
jgi:uncharacterized Fe-S cluster protein YjdI